MTFNDDRGLVPTTHSGNENHTKPMSLLVPVFLWILGPCLRSRYPSIKSPSLQGPTAQSVGPAKVERGKVVCVSMRSVFRTNLARFIRPLGAMLGQQRDSSLDYKDHDKIYQHIIGLEQQEHIMT